MIHRLLGLLIPVLLLARPAQAQLVVVSGSDPATARTEGLLSFAGFSYRRLAPSEIGPAALTSVRTVVLLHAPLTEPAAAALAQWAAAGGKLVLIGQEGPPELFRAAGVEASPPSPPVSYTDIERATAEAAGTHEVGGPGLPQTIRDAVTPSVTLSPLPGTRVLASRSGGVRSPAGGPGPAAVTLAPGGAVISSLFAPGERWEKSWLLQAVLTAVDPGLADAAASGLRRQAEEAFNAAAAHWARIRGEATFPTRESQERLRTLQALRVEWDGLRSRPGDGPAGADQGSEAPRLQAVIQRIRAFDLGLTPSMPAEIRGVWIHTYAPTDWDRVARQVKAAGLNCLFVRVGRGGNVIYPSALLPRDAWAEKSGGDEMQRAIEAAHRHGLRFFAWRVNFHMGSAPKAYRDRMAAEDRLVRDSHGVQAAFANPGDPRNTELEFQVMREMVEKYDVDGVQFDYIRYPDAPSFDFDYGPVSRREFERMRGRAVENWPADVLSGPLKTEYEDWERENINHLVARVYREVKRLKPSVQVSAAVWRSHRRYRALIKQDWPLWVDRGWLDMVVPMDYTPEPETFAATVDAQVALTRGKAPVAAGIGSWLLQTPEELVRQVEIAREAGAAGFVLFAYNAEQIEEQLAALRLGATATDTWTPFAAPPLRVTLASGAIAPKDAPLAVQAGAPLKVRVAAAGDARIPPGDRGHGYKDTKSTFVDSGVRAGGLGASVAVTSVAGLPETHSPTVSSWPPLRAKRAGSQEQRNASLSRWLAELETPDGALIRALGPVGTHGETNLTGAAPAGRFRPVIRGRVVGHGGEQPFVVRGPLIEGLPPAEMAALRAQERPPVFAGSRGGPDIQIGVYAGGLGAETVIEGLSKQGLRVAALHRLRPDHLAVVDTLILPQLADGAELDPPAPVRLRQWVESGHTLILTHDAIGARWHPRLFPELIEDAHLAPAATLVTTAALGEIAVGHRFHHGGADQFQIVPGPAAQVLVRENPGAGDGPSAAVGAPVVVAGRVGQGTVILIGFLSGYQQKALSEDEARLLAALTRYRASGAAGETRNDRGGRALRERRRPGPCLVGR